MTRLQFFSLTILSLLLGTCFHFFPLGGANISWLLFMLISSVSIIIIGYQKNKSINWRGIMFLFFACIIAVPNVLYTYNTLIVWQYLVSIFCLCTGILITASEYSLSRWETSFLKKHIESFAMFVTGIALYIRERKKQKPLQSIKESPHKSNVFKAFKGIIIGAPVLIIITSLLASADKMFSETIKSIIGSSTIFSGSTIYDILAIITISLFIVSYLTYIFFIQKDTTPETTESKKREGHDISIISFLVFLIAIVGLYSIIQIKYLLLGGALPAGYIYADYAKEGFRQLIAVTCILLSTYLSINNFFTKNKTTNILLFITIVSNGFLLYTAFYRFSTYIAAYNFTFLRLLPLSFMIMIGVLISIGLLKFFYEKINVPKTYIITLLLWFSIIGLINLDLLSLQRNIERYHETKKIDIKYIINNLKECKSVYDEGTEECKRSGGYEQLPYLLQLEKIMKSSNPQDVSLKELEDFLLWSTTAIGVTKNQGILNYNYSNQYSKILKNN